MLDIETSSSFEFFSGNNEYRGISDGMLMLIPEPSTIGLLGVGLLGMGLVRRKFSSFSCRSVRPSHLLLKRSRNKREQ